MNIIKWESNVSELVHKFENNDLNLGSQLVVYPGQTAFFVKGGTICDEFTSGTYTIKSENIPLLGKVINIPFRGDSPFKAEVWFVNQIELLDCKWGTLSPLQIEDPKYDVIVPIRAFGQYGFRINHPRIFLNRLVGNMPTFATSKVVDYFKGIIVSKLTTIIYNKLKDNNSSVLNLNSKVDELSEYCKIVLTNDFKAYGIDLVLFNLMSISVKEDDPSFQRLKEAKDAAAKIKIIGREDYRLSRSFDILEEAAKNEGNNTMGAAIGIGAGVGIGNTMGTIATATMQTMNVDCNEMPPIPIERYYIVINKTQQGPFSFDEIKQKISTGAISSNTFIWRKGLSEWVKVCETRDFRNLFYNDCPPPIPTI